MLRKCMIPSQLRYIMMKISVEDYAMNTYIQPMCYEHLDTARVQLTCLNDSCLENV